MNGGSAPTAPTYRSLALDFRVHGAAGEPLARRLTELYRACAARGARDGALDLHVEYDRGVACYELRAGSELLCRSDRADDFVEWFAWWVNRAAVERSEHEMLVIHAAGACVASRTVLLTGASGAGKSTLVSALTASGWTYCGEESLGVTPDGNITANPKPVALDQAARDALVAFAPRLAGVLTGNSLVAPHELGPAAPPGERAEPAVVIRPVYSPGCRARTTPISRASAAVLLADQSFNFAAMGGAGLRAVAAIARRAPAFELAFDDLDAATSAIDRLLAQSLRCDVDAAAASPPASRDGDFDVEPLGDEAVIWDPAREALHHLSASAYFIWSAARGGVAPSRIVDDVAAATGRDRAAVASDVEGCMDDLATCALLP